MAVGDGRSNNWRVTHERYNEVTERVEVRPLAASTAISSPVVREGLRSLVRVLAVCAGRVLLAEVAVVVGTAARIGDI